ncbi:MAG: chemotaxis protein CheW, partial [Thermosynechococcaceae cyanobacterium]
SSSIYLRFSTQTYLHTVIVHKNGQQLGLGVDQVLQILWCNSSQIQPAPTQHMTPQLAHCLQGYWSDPSGNILWVLDAESIMDTLV